MNATILIIELVSNANPGSTGHLLLQLGAILVLVALPLSLAALLSSLRNAPEGYEDKEGFHFTEGRQPTTTSSSTGAAILRPHNAG